VSIRWIKNVLIEGKPELIEIQLGDRHIGDKCFVRIGAQQEMWFQNISDDRPGILSQGKDILKKQLAGKQVQYPNGTSYDWR